VLKRAASGRTLAASGRGEANPVASNTKDGHDSPKGRALNRRVEILIPKR
jgi:OmpA-OmpF porin, OOP family